MIALTSPFSFRLIFSFHLRRAAVEGPSPWPWGICRCSSVGRAYGLLNPLGLRRSDSGQRPASSQSLAAIRRRRDSPSRPTAGPSCHWITTVQLCWEVRERTTRSTR